MAEVLEHQPESRAQPEVPRAWAPEVLAARDHGRGYILCAEGGAVPLTGREEIRHSVPHVCAVRK